MSSSMIKILITALAATSAVNAKAIPQVQNNPQTEVVDPQTEVVEDPATVESVPSATIRPVTPLPTGDVPELIANLKSTGTQVDRFNALLADDSKKLLSGEDLRSRVVFDFNSRNVPATGATGGAIALANINSFPILTDLGISVAMGFLGPCGLNTPHTHPRATEFLTLIEGERLESGFILENGFVDPDTLKPNEVRSSLSVNQGTVFPVGSNHWQFNPSCKNATFVAALSNEDPGVSQIAQNFFNLKGNVIKATLGFPESIDGKNIKQFRDQIPANVAEIVEDCTAKCGL